MRLVLACVILLFVAGCTDPAPSNPLPHEGEPAPVQPSYDAVVVVTQETPDGPGLKAQVIGVPLLPDGTLGAALIRNTDADGKVRFSFPTATTLLVRATGAQGWTQEGARIHIASQAVAAEGLTATLGHVYLPLYRSTLQSTLTHAWTNALASPGMVPDVEPATTFAPIALPDGLADAYLARLTGGAVAAHWTDSLDGRVATVAAGLAWDGAVWVQGEPSPATGTGERSAQWAGALAPSDVPQDADDLQAALLTHTAVVGTVSFSITTTLTFGGRTPPELGDDPCHLLLC